MRLSLLLAGFFCALPALAQEATPRIIGGDSATGDWPWAARLIIDTPIEGLCSGSVISDSWVITAAHCFYDDDGQVAPNGTRVSVEVGSQSTGDNPTDLAQSFHIHPEYNNDTFENDIALVRLPAGTAAPSVFPSLATGAALSELTGGNAGEQDEAVTAIGWGVTSTNAESGSPTLQKAALDYVPFSTCDAAWSNGLDENLMLCASELNPVDDRNQDTCFGDSGGPLFIGDDADPFIIGVTSFGEAVCARDRPTVYTRVLGMLDFVENLSASEGAPLVDVSLTPSGAERRYLAPGDTLNFSATLANDSQLNDASNVRVNADADSANAAINVEGNTCSLLGPCYSHGALAAGAGGTVLDITANQTTSQEQRITLTLSAEANDEDYRARTATPVTTLIYSNRPDLALTARLLNASHDADGSGEALIRVTVENLSTRVDASQTFVELDLPASTTVASVSDANIDCDNGCDIGALAQGQSRTFTLTLSSGNPQNGQVTLTAGENPGGDFPRDNNSERVTLRYPAQTRPEVFGGDSGGGAPGGLFALAVALLTLRRLHDLRGTTAPDK